jgi:hypothetical protein
MKRNSSKTMAEFGKTMAKQLTFIPELVEQVVRFLKDNR